MLADSSTDFEVWIHLCKEISFKTGFKTVYTSNILEVYDMISSKIELFLMEIFWFLLADLKIYHAHHWYLFKAKKSLSGVYIVHKLYITNVRSDKRKKGGYFQLPWFKLWLIPYLRIARMAFVLIEFTCSLFYSWKFLILDWYVIVLVSEWSSYLEVRIMLKLKISQRKI